MLDFVVLTSPMRVIPIGFRIDYYMQSDKGPRLLLVEHDFCLPTVLGARATAKSSGATIVLV